MAICFNIVVISPSVEGLSLLGAYEDSDEEDAGDVQRSGANNQSADIDSTLANFMAVSILDIEIRNNIHNELVIFFRCIHFK